MAKLQGGTRIYGTANVDSSLYVTSTVNAASFTVGSNFTANTTRLAVGIPILANNALGTAGQVLASNSTGGIYWTSGGNGYTGSAGTNGVIGYNGSIGYTGSSGVGYTGSAGTNGVIGYNGSVGYTGSSANLSPSNYVVQGKLSTDQSITGGGDVVIQFVDDFDPQNWWNASTYRFTPTIAGYYEVKLGVWWTVASSNTGQNNIQARTGGSSTFMILQMERTSTNARNVNGSKLVYLNGSSDYVDFTAYTDNTQSIQAGTGAGSGTWFSATLLTNGAAGYTGSAGTNGVIGYNGSIGPIGYTGSAGSGGGGGGFSNGQSIAVANLAFTNSISSSIGIAYMYVNTYTYSIDTVFV